MRYLTFIELSPFSKRRADLLSDDEFQALQQYLLENHSLGKYLQHTGGCQKIRWASHNNQGKSSGVRIIYYHVGTKGRLYLLLIYPKNAQDNLTQTEKALMKQITDKLSQEKE